MRDEVRIQEILGPGFSHRLPPSLRVRDVFSSDGEECFYVAVVKGVIDVPARLAMPNQPSVAKCPQLMGYGRLFELELDTQVVDASFVFENRGDDANTSRVRERFERICDSRCTMVVEWRRPGVARCGCGHDT